MAILDTLFGLPQDNMLGGLLGNEQADRLRQQALTSGLINTAIGYLAQPKNQRFGSPIPYLARAAMVGQQGAQGVYTDALRNYQSQLEIADAKRKQEQQTRLQEMLSGIKDPEERLLAELSPATYVREQVESQRPQKQKTFAVLTPDQATAYGLPTDRGQRYQMTESGVQLIGGTESKESKGPSYTDAYKNLAITMFGTDNPNELTPVQRKQLDETVRQRSLEKPPQTVVMTPRQVFQDEQALRKEYTAIPEVKLFGEVQNAYDTIKTSLTKQSPAGDLAGATKFMKLLDPGSVVRESELGMAMAATGALDRAVNYFNMLKSGQKLNPNQRKDFLDLSNQLYEAARQRKSAFDTQYADIASQNQLNPSNVVRGWKPSGGWSIKEKK